MSLNGEHWDFREYKQRMSTKEWKEILLKEEDLIVFRGNFVRLNAILLSPGVVEVSKPPLRGGEK